MTTLGIAMAIPAHHGMKATQGTVESMILTNLLLLSCVVFVEED